MGPGAVVAVAYVLELGRRLREVREKLGLTQQEVADAADLAPAVVSRLENSYYQSPGLRTIWRVAVGLGVSVADILPTDDAQPTRLLERRILAMLRSADEQDLKLALSLVAAVLAHGGGCQCENDE